MRRGRLLIRLYVGIVASVFLTVGLTVLFVSVRSGRMHELAPAAQFLVTELARLRHDKAALQSEAERLRGVGMIKISLYDTNGELIVSTTEPALPMISPSLVAKLATMDQLQTQRF